MIVPFGHVFLLAGLVFAMGLVCLVAHRNLIMTLVGVEVMMNAAAIAFVAAAEVSVGLAIVVSVYRRTGSIDPDHYDILKG